MTLRLQTRFLSLMCALAAVFVVGLVAVRSEQRQSLDRLLDVQRVELETTLATLLRSRSAQLRTFANDYSLWDEMVEYTATHDAAWADANVGLGIATFDADGAWVFDADLKGLYAVVGLESPQSLTTSPLDPERLRDLLHGRREWFAHFFDRSGDAVTEYFTAPIQPGNDAARTSTPHGFLLIARAWDTAEIEAIGALVRGRASLHDEPESEPEPSRDGDPSNIVIHRDLLGIDGEHVAQLHLNVRSPFISAARSEVDRVLITSTTFALFCVALVVVFFVRWVNLPLRRIVDALRRNSVERLDRVRTLAQEYGALTTLLERSIQHREELTREIDERRRMEAEVVRARDRAERANAAKSQFLANMSHEIRTPLNGVLGMARLLLDTELSEEQRDLASTIRSSGEALLGVLNDVLDFSKIEAGKLTIESVAFAPRRILDETIQLFSAAAQGKGLALFADLDASLPAFVLGDPLRLRQIASNLVGNAIKFTQRGQIVLRASVAESTATETVLAVEVEDSGIGIPPEYLSHLFEAFSQADGSTSRRFGGTGLGLAISKRLATLMGGTIEATSTVGRGTTFRFTVRCAPMANSPAIESHPAIRGRVILIADDLGTRRAVLAKRLFELGAEVVVAGVDPAACAAQVGDGAHVAIVAVESEQRAALACFDAIKRASPATKCMALAPFGTRFDAAHPGTPAIESTLALPWTSELLQSRLAGLFVVPSRVAVHEQAAPSRDGPMPLVLLAEDNPVNQKVAGKMLERLGLRCEIVGNGRLAVEAVRRTKFDLVLMDCQMPEMDGYEATAALRAMESAGADRLTIVAMTANSMSSDRFRCLGAGMDDYVAKPVDFEILRATLAKYLPITASV
ncbi:MAG: response regulator [Planctomycetes bacterium]|nr:response regulator [Planctomycetota bacterium]